MILNERHSFIDPIHISREEFQDIAIKATYEDSSLSWFMHAHPYEEYGAIECNGRCQVVRNGMVSFVTHSDDAIPVRGT